MQCQQSLGNDTEGVNVNFIPSIIQHKNHSITIYKSEQPFEWNTNSIYCYCHQDNKKYTVRLLSEEALQIAVKRREAKSKVEKERYTLLNSEFQRIAKRDKKAFLSDQCKEIEENNRMGKTRDLFKKIRDTKGTFHAKMGSIKDRSAMDLTETEDIKKRWQEYTEELYKKDL